MFSDLLSFLKEKELFKEIEIKDLHGSHCDCKRLVLNLKQIKIDFCSVNKIPEPKTVNGLLFNDNNNLFLVQTENYYTKLVYLDSDRITEEIESGDINSKMNGTIDFLSLVLYHHKVCTDFKTFFDAKPREKIKALILITVSPEDYLKIVIGNIDRLKIKHEIISEIAIIPWEDLDDAVA